MDVHYPARLQAAATIAAALVRGGCYGRDTLDLAAKAVEVLVAIEAELDAAAERGPR